MCVFHIFKIVQVVPNRVTHHMYLLQIIIFFVKTEETFF